jgi:hypothetical protein
LLNSSSCSVGVACSGLVLVREEFRILDERAVAVDGAAQAVLIDPDVGEVVDVDGIGGHALSGHPGVGTVLCASEVSRK